MEIKTKLYNYNIDAIRSSGKTEDTVNFNYLLGYVDFTNTGIVSEMLKHADSEDDNYYNVQKDIIINFASYNIEALKDGLESFNLKLEDIEPLRLSKMIAYALGYIDYSDEE